MQISSIVVLCTLALTYATDPLTLTIGSTAYVMTGTQVAVAAASIGALAIAKELLLIAKLNRHYRGRRELNSISQTPLHFEAFFDEIAQSDIDDCGKLLVCHSFAKGPADMTSEEKSIVNLFDDLQIIDPHSGYAEYQLAAYAGTFKHPELCVARYNRCKVPVAKLGNMIKNQ